MKTYRVPVIHTNYGVIEVKAKGLQEAVELIEDSINSRSIDLEKVFVKEQLIKLDFLKLISLINKEKEAGTYG